MSREEDLKKTKTKKKDICTDNQKLKIREHIKKKEGLEHLMLTVHSEIKIGRG